MTAMLGKLRRRVLTPNESATRVSERGFHVKTDSSVRLLEKVGHSFLAGFAYAAEARTAAASEAELEGVEYGFRGFAYEGATMAFAIRDGLRLGGAGRNVTEFLAGPARRHVYMAHIGIGWAFARLPRWRWGRVAPGDRLLRWLVLDGYGFHQAYFRTARYVTGHYQDPGLPWPAGLSGWYSNRAIDQGIGRAIWFVAGTDPERVANVIDTFPERRRADLFCGAGLAATYAGGADESELRGFWKLAGPYRRQVAQGCAFAAKTRVLSGLVIDHTRLASAVFCDLSPEEAAAVTDVARQSLPEDGSTALADQAGAGVPAFEVWRQRIADEFALRGRC